MVTVIYLVQIEPKNGFETEKVKKGYRQCGYLPQSPTSLYTWRASFICHARLIFIQHITYSYVIHNSCMHVIWFIYAWHDSFVGGACNWISYVTRDSFTRDAWLSHTRPIRTWCTTPFYLTHDLFIRDTWLIHTWDMTHCSGWHDLFICSACHRINYVTRDWFIYDTGLIYVTPDSFMCDTWLIHVCERAHPYMTCDSFINVTQIMHATV